MPFYGQIGCQFPTKVGACKNKAYYEYQGRFGCGVHIKGGNRTELAKQPKQEKEADDAAKYQVELREIQVVREVNYLAGRKGETRLCRMFMMKSPMHTPGYLNVYPNYKDQGRKDGSGCASLSPKSMGPVEHGQPGLPRSLNLENYYQSSKVFAIETNQDGSPSTLFFENQLRFFNDAEPHRHKYKGTQENKNIPLYFLWIDKKGKQHRLTYIQSRQFYCNFYERFALVDANFILLKSLIDTGVNLQICGYDAYGMEGTHEEAYLDPRSPYGHEKVLLAMLVLNPEDYPWRKHKTFDF